MFPFWALFLLVVCYLIGALPFGLWIARRQGIDLTAHGSGNTGAANAARALGLRGGITVLLLDVLKGSLAAGLAPIAFLPSIVLHLTQVSFGLAAIVGHNYSVFRGFKGGKGIATTFGVLLVLCPKATLLAALLWLGMTGLTRFSSVGSLSAVTAMPLLLALYSSSPTYIGFGLAAAALAFWRHRDNLERLVDGREHKTDF